MRIQLTRMTVSVGSMGYLWWLAPVSHQIYTVSTLSSPDTHLWYCHR